METPTPTLFDLASLTYNSAEETSYYGFYYHFLYIIRKNLAPPGITVDGVTSGEDGDKMTISLMDFAAVMWLEKIDPRLAERVQIDFRVPISEGQRLWDGPPDSKMHPQYAEKDWDGMVKVNKDVSF